MTLRLTPTLLSLTYDVLRETLPFKLWRLPASDEVEFIVARTRKHAGAHTTYVRTREHVIEVSEKCVGHIDTLIRVMAHEMVHAAQAQARSTTPNAEHNKDFQKRAKRVCHHHGFDPKEF